jgi:hypothetical protein
MIYQLLKVVRDVRVALDENVSSEALMATGDVDTLSLGELIASKVLEAVRRVETAAPVHLLDSGHNFGDAVCWCGDGSGRVQLPGDFMRLIVFEMDDWSKAVYSAISADSAEYDRQRSRYKSLRGSAERPVCAIVSRAEGKVLEFYSCKSEDATVSQAVYLPYPTIDCDGGVEICELCYRAVVYMAGALTLLSLGETERAQRLMELSNSIIES